MSIEISVIIPTRNRIKKLKRCLKSILSQGYRKKKYEIIIIDNVSSDSTNSYILSLIKKFKNIRLVKNDKNMWVAFSRNRAIKLARGKIIAFIDDDCIVPRNWLNEVESNHKNHPKEFGIGGKIISLDPNSLISKFRTFQRLYSLKKDRIDKNHMIYIPSCSTSYKRCTFKKIGYFNESYETADDIEFNMRLLKIGKPIYFENKITVFHDYQNSLKYFIKKSYWYGIGIPLIKKEYPKIPLIAPISFFYGLVFLFAPFISVFLKIFSINGFKNKIRFFPLVILDELAYRLGIIRGMLRIHNLLK